MTRPIGGPHEAAALILSFLAHVGEARVARIVAFMATDPLRVASGTTRNVLSRMARRGKIARSGRGKYRHLPRIETG